MEVGVYNKKPIDFDVYRLPNFKFKKTGPWGIRGYGCGANALTALTGAPPWLTQELNGYSRDFKDRFMLDFLEDLGFKTIPITQCEMSVGQGESIMSKIKRDHLLLVSQLFSKNEGTWTVAYKGKLVHNFEINPIYPLEFVNRPILTAYVVFHKKFIKT